MDATFNTYPTEMRRVTESFLETKRPSPFELCKYPSLRNNCIMCGVLYSISNYVYYGTVFGLEALKGSIYFESLFSSGASMIGYLFVKCMLSRFRRRSVFTGTLVLILFTSLAFYLLKIPDACADDPDYYCW
jgi:Na+/melibiose symporter-like transporter